MHSCLCPVRARLRTLAFLGCRGWLRGPCWLQELQIHNYFIITQDRQHALRLAKRGLAVYCAGCREREKAQQRSGQGTQEAQPLNYGSTEYKEFILARTKAVGDILKAGYNVLLADVDAAWLADPFAFLKVGCTPSTNHPVTSAAFFSQTLVTTASIFSQALVITAAFFSHALVTTAAFFSQTPAPLQTNAHRSPCSCHAHEFNGLSESAVRVGTPLHGGATINQWSATVRRARRRSELPWRAWALRVAACRRTAWTSWRSWRSGGTRAGASCCWCTRGA